MDKVGAATFWTFVRKTLASYSLLAQYFTLLLFWQEPVTPIMFLIRTFGIENCPSGCRNTALG